MSTLIETLNRVGAACVPIAYSMLLQSTLLILVIAGFDLALRKRSRAVVRYAFWMLLLIKLVLPVNLSSPTSLITITASLEYTPPIVYEDAPLVYEEPPIETLQLSEAPGDPQPEAVLSQPPAPPPPPVRQIVLDAMGWAALFWLAVVVSGFSFVAWRAVRLRRIVRSYCPAPAELIDVLNSCRATLGIRREVELKIAQGNVTPALCGWIRPCIVLPQSLAGALERNELRAVLLHELVHLKRHDVPVNLAQTLLQIVHFYNPLLWLANRRIRKLREDAVDECVLVAMGQEAASYPETLVNVAKLVVKARALPFGSVGIMESRSAFGARIRRMLARPFPKTSRLGLVGSVALVALALATLPMAEGVSGESAAPAKESDKEPVIAESRTQGDGAAAFLENLRILPDPNFPEYQSTTNRLYVEAETLLPLILPEIEQPLPDLNDRDLRTRRAKYLWALSFMGSTAAPAIPALLREVEEDDPATFRGFHPMDHPPAYWAASALGAIGPAASNTVPSLIEAAHFGNFNAYVALAQIAPDSGEVETLVIEGFRDLTRGNGGNAPFSRLAAFRGLYFLSATSQKARQVIFDAITDGDPYVRQAAVNLIRIHKVAGGEEAIAAALKDAKSRAHTASALVKAGDRSDGVRDALIDALKRAETRLIALEALESFAWQNPQLAPEVLPLLESPEKPLRKAAVSLLSRFPPSAPGEVLDAVLPLVDETDTEIRQLAVLALGTAGTNQANVIPALRKALSDPNPETRSTTLNVIERLEAAELSQDVARLFDDPSDDVRTAAWMTTAKFPGNAPVLLPKLTAALATEQAWAAAAALGTIGPVAAPAVPALIKSLSGTNSVNNAVVALGWIGPAARDAVPSLLPLVDSDDPLLRFNAALALWRIERRPVFVKVLRDRLESEQNWDRLSRLNRSHMMPFFLGLARELGPEDGRKLAPAVQRHLDDRDPGVREAARLALEAIGSGNAPNRTGAPR